MCPVINGYSMSEAQRRVANFLEQIEGKLDPRREEMEEMKEVEGQFEQRKDL